VQIVSKIFSVTGQGHVAMRVEMCELTLNGFESKVMQILITPVRRADFVFKVTGSKVKVVWIQIE